jgi:hypothetical protein
MVDVKECDDLVGYRDFGIQQAIYYATGGFLLTVQIGFELAYDQRSSATWLSTAACA